MKDDESSSPAELAEAEERRRAVDAGAEPVAELLVAALRPRELPDAEHEAILARVLGADALAGAPLEAPADEEEARDAAALARALEGGEASHPLARWVRILRSAYAPRPLDDLRHQAILGGALRRGRSKTSGRSFALAAAGALALAASVAGLWLSQPDGEAPSAAHAPQLVESRSTAPLFTVEDFPHGGGKTSERIDRIAGAREVDYRHNQFERWGVE